MKEQPTTTTEDPNAITKRYKLRKGGASLVITLPREAVEREARRLGISEEEAEEKLVGIWSFNSFVGLRLIFKVREISS